MKNTHSQNRNPSVLRGAVGRIAYSTLLSVLLGVGIGLSAYAQCAKEDFQTYVNGKDQCMVMRAFGAPTADAPKPKTLLVWMHGDVSGGGPANYHFDATEKAAKEFAHYGVVSVAMVRAGYPDGYGNQSGVAFLHSGRRDHYTRVNVNEMTSAVARLKAHYGVQRVVFIGHSGGAATSAIALALQPDLAQAAVLVACPCDLAKWRGLRNATPFTASEDPIKLIAKMSPKVQVIAITGRWDDNTMPVLAQDYVAALTQRGIKAEFVQVGWASHNNVFTSSEVHKAVHQILESFDAEK